MSPVLMQPHDLGSSVELTVIYLQREEECVWEMIEKAFETWTDASGAPE